MADPASPFHFEDIPVDEARRMSRGPRMDPQLYHALQEKIRSLDTTATRMTIPEGTNPTTLKNRILRVAVELGIPVTVRKTPGGLIFWRSSEEDLQQAQETASRLQTGQRRLQSRPRGRRLRGTR
jgi:hypothetical protein